MYLKLIELKGPLQPTEHHYQAAYKLWRTVWREENPATGTTLYSDQFTRQDYCVGLFEGEYCIAILLFKFLDLRAATSLDDSLLGSWPPSLLSKELKPQRAFLVMNGLCIAHAYRKQEIEGQRLTEVFICASVRRFMESQCEQLVGFTRNSRKINHWCRAIGGRGLLTTEYRNEPTDLFIFNKWEFPCLLPQTKNLIQSLWAPHREMSLSRKKAA